jgi:hypothetical protein
VIVAVEIVADYDTAADLEADDVFVLSFKTAVVSALQGSFEYVTVDDVTIGAITASAERLRSRSLLSSSFHVEFDIALASEDGETVSYTNEDSESSAIDVHDISSTVGSVLEDADAEFASIELENGTATASTFVATAEVSVVVSTTDDDASLDDDVLGDDHTTDGSSKGSKGLPVGAILGIVFGCLAGVGAAWYYFVKVGNQGEKRVAAVLPVASAPPTSNAIAMPSQTPVATAAFPLPNAEVPKVNVQDDGQGGGAEAQVSPVPIQCAKIGGGGEEASTEAGEQAPLIARNNTQKEATL